MRPMIVGGRMITKAWALIRGTVSAFIEHEDLTRGAAIAYYTIFSIAPLLIIVIAIAGLVFDHDAAQGAIIGHLGGLIEKQSAEILQSYNAEQVQRLSETTIAYYDRFVRAFWDGTQHHDVSQNYAVRVGFAWDSPLEGAGFELLVPGETG